MSALDRLLSVQTPPPADAVLTALLTDLRDTAFLHGRPSFVWTFHNDHTKRLLIDMLRLAEGDSDLADFLTAYRIADRHECALNGRPDEIWSACERMDNAAGRLRERFHEAARYHEEQR